MKIFKTLSGQNRIVIFFILAILIPSILLGILAFRGIKNDQALVAQQRRQDIIAAGKLIADNCMNAIHRAEQDIYQWGNTQDTAMDSRLWSQDSALMVHIALHPCVDNAILLDASGTPRIHAQSIVFVPDEFSPTQEQHISDGDQYLIEIGWQHEFQSKDLRHAAQYYAGILPKLKTSQAICMALMARARIQKKMGQTAQAIETFRHIRNTCLDARINQQMPVSHATCLELCQLYLESGDTVSAINEIPELYLLLLENAENIGHSAFQIVVERANNLTEKCRKSSTQYVLSATKRIDSLRNVLDQYIATTQMLHTLFGKVTNDFVKTDSSDGFRRISLKINGQRAGISTSPLTMHGYWLLILNQDAIIDEFITPSITLDDSRKQWHWRLLDEDGAVLRQSPIVSDEEDFVATMLNTGAFTWSMHLWQKPVPLFDSLIFSGRSIYLLIFFFIIAILIFGFIFTYQAVNSEILLARMKSTFISTVSHEFKSPLTSIRHMTEMLNDGKVQSEERKREYYGIMLEQSQRLSHLIDNLLDFSKIEEGKRPFHFESTDMSAFLQDLTAVYKKRISNEDISVGVSIPEALPTLAIDRSAMAQVFHNLLDNAYKYSGDSKMIEVEASKENASVRISIRDYGYGIPKAEIPKIFERFYRVGDALTSKIKGSGLGLTLVKQIVDAHAGQVLVDSTPGEGSTFHVILPTSYHGNQV